MFGTKGTRNAFISTPAWLPLGTAVVALFVALSFGSRNQARAAAECFDCYALRQNTFQAMSPGAPSLANGWSAIESHLAGGRSPVARWDGDFVGLSEKDGADLPADHPIGEVGGFGARDFASVFDPQFTTSFYKHGRALNTPLAPWNAYLPAYGAGAWAQEANDYNSYLNALYAY